MNSRLSQARVLVGDCRELMRSMADASVDAIVTDPPYELGFMGKKWDASGIAYDLDVWREALRVLKPGGHLLAFGGTRTYHRMTCAIEDAGFEVRDSIHWIYGSGFPKSLDVSKAIDKAAGAEREVIGVSSVTGERRNAGSEKYGGGNGIPQSVNLITAPVTDAAKQWSGWGTALKPAHEPIVVARKPLDGTVAANVLEHETGAINVDACRVGKPIGRWPANIVLGHSPDCEDECAEGCAVAEMDRQSGDRPSQPFRENVAFGSVFPLSKRSAGGYSDTGGASRFFPCFRYQAKASKRDRGDGNTHPTVKPVELMRWLVRLVTPPGGLVLDPFTGSGTTGVACVREGFDFVGLELLDSHADIARRRIEAAQAELPAQMALDVVGSDNG